jgi:hypothetical protein
VAQSSPCEERTSICMSNPYSSADPSMWVVPSTKGEVGSMPSNPESERTGQTMNTHARGRVIQCSSIAISNEWTLTATPVDGLFLHGCWIVHAQVGVFAQMI